jgi:hypothetical protein
MTLHRFVTERCNVDDVPIPQTAVSVQCEGIPDGRRLAAQVVADRYGVGVGPVMRETRLSYVDKGTPTAADAAVRRALAV